MSCTCHLSYSGKPKIGRLQSMLGKSEPPISKINSAKRAGSMTEAVECLPSKNEVLGSNPSTAPPKRDNSDLWHHCIIC
jgi:hypothetical protein